MACAWQFRCILFLTVLVGLLSCIGASDNHQSEGSSSEDRSNANLVYLSAISVATICCFTVLLLVCACCFHRGFAKFDETTTQETVVGQSYTNFNDFSPPVHSTPSFPPGLEPDTVTIEPLPALAESAGTAPGGLGQSSWLKAGGGMPELAKQDDLKHIHNPRFLFPRSQLSYVDEMGSGWFGKVLQGEAHRLHPGLRKTRVVIKQMRDTTTAEEQVLFLQEVQPYREVNHPNVLMLLGQCIESIPFLLILEYAPYGDLKDYLHKHEEMIQDMAHRDVQLRMACDIVNGLMWLHQADFIHIDLAARNCLVCADTSVKIGDYGLSFEKYPDDYYITNDSRHAVPIRWLGPEVIEITDRDMVPKKVTKESNVWSFGVIMLELCTGGKKPYSNLTNDEVLKQVVMEQEIRLDKPSLDVRYASRWFEIMMFCWLEADMRPTMKEVHELLIHLRSNKDRIEMDDFQQRWDTLKPAVMQDSSESSKEESQFPDMRDDTFETAPAEGDIFSSGTANGLVAQQEQTAINSAPNVNVNMNANVDVLPIMNAGGDFQTTPLGNILKTNVDPSEDTQVPEDTNEINFVIQPTVAHDTEMVPPVLNANEAGDPTLDMIMQPADHSTIKDNFASSIPAPRTTNIPEVLISSPTSPPATDEDNVVFKEEIIAPTKSNDVQAAIPNVMDDFDFTSDTEPTTPTNAVHDMDGIKQISNPLFQFDTETTTPISTPTQDLSMTSPPTSNGTVFDDIIFTSTPSRTSDLPAEVPISDDDSSQSFMSATSAQLKKGDDEDTSSFNTMMTSQSDDPSFFSFSSQSTSRNNSIQTSTDGSYKTITDSNVSDDQGELTYVEQSEEWSGPDDSISDHDGTPETQQPDGFVSLSGNIVLRHEELPPEASATERISSVHSTMLEPISQSQPKVTDDQQQQPKMLQIHPQTKKGSFSIKISSKKVTQTPVKHVRHVRQLDTRQQMYKQGDDIAIVQDVKGDDLPQSNLSQSAKAFKSLSTSQLSSKDVIQLESSGESVIQTPQKSMQHMETHRTVTVVHSVSSSGTQHMPIIDLMSSPAGDSQPPGGYHMSSSAADDSTSFPKPMLQPSILEPSILEPTMSAASVKTPLIPNLMDDTPVNVEHTASLSSDGCGLTMKQSMAVQGGEAGQSTQVQWNASANVQQEHTVASSTDFRLPDFTVTLKNPDSEQPQETDTPGLIDFLVDPTPARSPDQQSTDNP